MRIIHHRRISEEANRIVWENNKARNKCHGERTSAQRKVKHIEAEPHFGLAPAKAWQSFCNAYVIVISGSRVWVET